MASPTPAARGLARSVRQGGAGICGDAAAGLTGKTQMLRATEVLAAGEWKGKPADIVELDFDGRTRRRIKLQGTGGLAFLLDLPAVPNLRKGDGLLLDDGRIIAVEAAAE